LPTDIGRTNAAVTIPSIIAAEVLQISTVVLLAHLPGPKR
jgi:hypothetical protein